MSALCSFACRRNIVGLFLSFFSFRKVWARVATIKIWSQLPFFTVIVLSHIQYIAENSFCRSFEKGFLYRHNSRGVALYTETLKEENINGKERGKF
jgi:hypothetical protein